MKTKTKPDIFIPKNVKKIFLIMKITLFLILASAISLQASSVFSQNKNMTVDMQNATVREVINEIEKQGGISFLFNDNLQELNRYVSVSHIDQPAKDVLKNTLDQANMTYQEIKDDFVVLLKKYDNLMQQPINGTVTNIRNEPLPGVTVVIKGTTQGTITNTNGDYSFLDIPEDATLVFSFVGMIAQEIAVGNQTTINVTMQEDVIGLEEVVAIGYGTQRRGDISSSISSVAAEDLLKVKAHDLTGNIAGRIPGVHVTAMSGGPGAGGSIRIRGVGTTGSNEPLYVVDGFPISSSTISFSTSSYGSTDHIGGLSVINPNDIESIDILKDAAAAAIYGARAANGVVLITTKKGAFDTDITSVNVNAYTGFAQPWKIVEPLNAEEFATLANELMISAGEEPFDAFRNPASLGEGTNWMDAIYRTAPVSNIDLSVSGGGANHRSYLSLGFMDQKGTIIETDYIRYSGKASVDFVQNKFQFGGQVNFAQNQGNGVRNELGNFGINNLAMKMFPNLGLDDILDNNTPYATSQADNPYLRAKHETNYVDNVRFHLLTYGQYEILENLTFRTNVGVEFNNNRQTRWVPSYDRGFAREGMANLRENYTRGNNFLIENTLSYNVSFESHNFDIVIGQTAEENNNAYNNTHGRDYLNEQLVVINASDASLRLASGNESQYRLASYLGRINYNYESRYLFSASLRRDGSSNFGPENIWGWFPSVSAAWNITNENFAQNAPDFLSSLKLRGSWGQLGNDRIGAFGYLSLYGLGGNANNYTFGTNETLHTGASLSRPGNPSLKWETNEQINMAIDANFWDNRVYTTIEYYVKNTKDLLYTLPVSFESGFTSNPRVNGGEIVNKGWEFDLGIRSQYRGLSWNISANLSTLYNEVLSLGEGEPIVGKSMYGSGMAQSYTEVGDEIGYFKGYVFDGIYQSEDEIDRSFQPNARQGDLKWKDIDGDGLLTDNDIVKIGSPWPDFMYGGNVDLAYRSFDFNLVVTGVAGNQIYNETKRELLSIKYPGGAGIMSGSKEALERWTPESGGNTVPALRYLDENNNMNTSSSWMVEDGDYLRVRSVTIGYSISPSINQRLNVSNLRIYLNANNLFTFTGYSGMDPEIRSSNPLVSGFDGGIYPQPRTISAGINLSF